VPKDRPAPPEWREGLRCWRCADPIPEEEHCVEELVERGLRFYIHLHDRCRGERPPSPGEVTRRIG
jgi:hypothetical protein